jgi:hypothetical protein
VGRRAAPSAFAAGERFSQVPDPVFILKNRFASLLQYLIDRFHDCRHIFERIHPPKIVAAIRKCYGATAIFGRAVPLAVEGDPQSAVEGALRPWPKTPPENRL